MANIPFQLLKDLESVRSLFRNLKIGLYTIDVHGNFLEATEEFLEILGLSSIKELRQSNARERLNLEPYDRNPAMPRQDRLVRELDLSVRRADGRLMTLLDISYASHDEKTGDLIYHGIIMDVTDRKRPERSALEQPSLRDPLTGSYNRLFLEEFERRMIEIEKNWGCIYIFIDHFKQFNDRYGYETGEEVLRKMSHFLMRYARASDGVIRMGDDEFLVLLPNVDSSIVSRINRRFRQAALGQAPITFSMGTATRHTGESLEKTILRASRDLTPVRVLLRTPKVVRR
ncbi:sensor domain-containing diguanylate cyclase [bacterium]|nr:sensor domain-containing diguanylate cyclase [bacterium]MCI0605195.1 sensor domain-containing diguanylate cyclase [bacterium]